MRFEKLTSALCQVTAISSESWVLIVKAPRRKENIETKRPAEAGRDAVSIRKIREVDFLPVDDLAVTIVANEAQSGGRFA
jgi:hypothetical protein